MSESPYLQQELGNHPDEPEYVNDLRILRRFVWNGSFGYHESDDVIFQRLRNRYPRAYPAFGEERRRETLEKYKDSPYIELQRRVYPNNPDKDGYLKALERLRNVMILFKSGYGNREMAMLKVNSKRRYPEAYDVFRSSLCSPWWGSFASTIPPLVGTEYIAVSYVSSPVPSGGSVVRHTIRRKYHQFRCLSLLGGNFFPL